MPVSLRNQCVSESSSVSLRNQKSTVLAVFRRVSVVSGVRSLGLYLVVSCCVSQLETSVQCSSDSRIQEATSASVKLFSVIVMCAAVNLQIE
jgi:hypothetical protein